MSRKWRHTSRKCLHYVHIDIFQKLAINSAHVDTSQSQQQQQQHDDSQYKQYHQHGEDIKHGLEHQSATVVPACLAPAEVKDNTHDMILFLASDVVHGQQIIRVDKRWVIYKTPFYS